MLIPSHTHLAYINLKKYLQYLLLLTEAVCPFKLYTVFEKRKSWLHCRLQKINK